ncbi:zinc finger protein 706-like [Lytechinus pictus]|uniref:zinc finger protein 706-like n=1 Tax=Lytechinus pictus TaxID=7653 RepID=UPI00240D505F|nr:zinc finger protein 706-like [Lytechinus pictus]
MARGQQKIQSQQKRAKEIEKKKKAATGMTSKAAGMKALTFKCAVCMTQMPDPKTYKQHFENKHPKAPLPAELKEA